MDHRTLPSRHGESRTCCSVHQGSGQDAARPPARPARRVARPPLVASREEEGRDDGHGGDAEDRGDGAPADRLRHVVQHRSLQSYKTHNVTHVFQFPDNSQHWLNWQKDPRYRTLSQWDSRGAWICVKRNTMLTRPVTTYNAATKTFFGTDVCAPFWSEQKP